MFRMLEFNPDRVLGDPCVVYAWKDRILSGDWDSCRENWGEGFGGCRRGCHLGG